MKKIFLKYIYMPLIAVILTVVVTKVTINGFDIISSAVDKLLAGDEVKFEGIVYRLGIFTAAAVFCTFAKSYLIQKYSALTMHELRNETAKKLIALEYEYYDKNGSGNMTSHLLSDVKEIQQLIKEIIPEIASAGITTAIMIAYIFTINKLLLLAIAISYPFVFFGVKAISREIIRLAKQRRSLVDTQTNEVYDILGGIDIVKSYNLYEKMLLRLEKAMNDIFLVEVKRAKITSAMTAARMLLKWIPSVICLCVGATLCAGGDISMGSLMIFILITERVFEGLSSIPYYINEAADSFASLQRADELLKEKEEGAEGITEIGKSENVIEFKNAAFSYTEEEFIKNFNLTVKKGERIAFTGSSGSGKSTVFKLICGFYPLSEGSYFFFGNDFYKTNTEFAREKIALISQDTFLFPSTIKDNVSFGNVNADFNEIQNACRLANIHDFIMTLPYGYETQVGERGIKLSGGEKQRISIARAFLKKAEIILMDEPVSALDSENERILNETIKNFDKDKTVIIIAHRLSVAKQCDRICVFENGSICEQGTYGCLMSENSRYSRLEKQGI